MAKRETVATICRMCGSNCGILAHIEDNRLVEVEGNPEHLRNRGRICVKGSSAPTWLNQPERLRQPLKKNSAGAWELVEMEQALDEIAAKLLQIQQRYGANAIGLWKGEGTDFSQQKAMYRRFIHAVGSPNYFSNDTQCHTSREIALVLTYGCWPKPDYANARLIVQWGLNVPISDAYAMQYINEGRERGAKLVVVDTRYTEVARQADLFLRLRPATDGALAWGIIRELIRREAFDQAFIEHFTVGFAQVREYATAFTPERVEEITGVAASDLLQLVDWLAAARPRVINWFGTGLEHHTNGVNSSRAVTLIDALCGTTDRPGGLHIPVDLGLNRLTLYEEKPLRHLDPIGSAAYPVLYELCHECHSLILMDQILSGEPYPFKGLIMTSANPALTNANSRKVIEALSALELLVVKDLFLTETAQLADYVLPAASFLEREELFPFAAENAICATGKFIDQGLQTEYDFVKGLAERMGAGAYFPWADDHAVTEWLLEPTGFSVADLRTKPGGFYLGDNPFEKHRTKAARGEKGFATESGKVELYSSYLARKGLDALPYYRPPHYLAQPNPDYPYLLASGARRQKYFHGRYRNIPQFAEVEPHGVLEIHPQDAKALGVKDGDAVCVTSRTGSFESYVQIMHEKEICPGTVQQTHGFAAQNANAATDDSLRDPISGFPVLKSTQVKIEKV